MFIITSCAETNVVEDSLIDSKVATFQNERQDFLHSTGYVEMIANNFNGDDWKANYIKTTSENANHEFLNQYRLNVVDYMVRNTDFLSNIAENEAQFLMDMYNDFQTKGSLEAKHLMLVKLSDFFPKETITELRTNAYVSGLEYKDFVEGRLQSFIEATQGKTLTKLDELTLKAKQNRVDDANNFIGKFAPSS